MFANGNTNATIPATIPSGINLRKLNLIIEKNKRNEERAVKIVNKYAEALDRIIKKNSSYQTKSIVDDIVLFKREREAVKNDRYHNYTQKNTLVDTILHIVEWFKDYQTNFTFKTFEKLIEQLIFEKHSRYFIKNIIEAPFQLIQIEYSPINFNQAFRISKELGTDVSDELLIEKWAVFTVQENNGSFYKIKSHTDSKNIYKEYNDRCYRQGWYWLLRKFCDENKLLSKYGAYIGILNNILIEHKTMKHLYGIKELVKIEKNIGDTLIESYYTGDNDDTDNEDDDTNQPNLDQGVFEKFITDFEKSKSSTSVSFKLNLEQISSIRHAITDKLCIITGPPGTGKSTIIEAVIEWFNIESKNTRREYVMNLMAPTGKALKGLLDKCPNIKNKNICGTLHKCVLNTFPKIIDGIERDQSHDQSHDQSNEEEPSVKNKCDIQYIDKMIVDECSMIDIFMFKKLLKWCNYFECGLILCGDIKQLPPVGKGRPFECIINCELFTTIYLTEIKRQDNGKLKDCIVNINNHELTIADFDDNTTRFIDHTFESVDDTSQVCNYLVEKYGRDKIAFITPENNKECGVFEMNKLLQNNVYNGDTPYTQGFFKNNDYVMRTENDYGDEIIRVNGDTGKLEFYEAQIMNSKTKKYRLEKCARVHYDDDPNNIEEVPLNEISDHFKLNYCNTVHKYQGSQKDVVVFICSPKHNSLSWGTNRLKLAYTAISRAAKNLIILGDKKTFFDIQNCKDEPFVSSFMSEFNEYEF